jgi:hypothetical protein
MTALDSGELKHLTREFVLFPFTLLTFFCYELPKRLLTVFVNKLYELAQLPIIWAFKPVSVIRARYWP